MSTTDPETGLTILGAPPEQKSFPIDPKLMPELRALEEAREKTRLDAEHLGYNLVMMIGTASAVGQVAFVNDKAWLEFIYKIADMNGIPRQSVKGTDLEKGLLTLR